MESNALEKSTNSSVCLRILCLYSFDDLTDCQNLWDCGAIPLKAALIFPMNFLDFRLDIIEKQGIIILSRYRSKNYAFVVLRDSKVTLLRVREKYKLLSICLLHFVNRLHCIVGEVYCQSFFFANFSVYFIKACCFSLYNFFNISSSSSSLNLPSLIYSWPLLIFWIGLSVISVGFLNRFLKCSFHLSSLSSWLAAFDFALRLLFLLLSSFTVCLVKCIYIYIYI